MSLFRRRMPELTERTIRERILFFGRVQHVGFRFTLRAIARENAVTGYADNLPDGSVLAELQGLPEAIERVLVELGDQPRIVIERMERARTWVVPEERSFRTGSR